MAQFSFDADGRTISQASSVLGTEYFNFNQAGQLTSTVEPAAVGGGTISYGYYADGLRANAGYSDSTQTFALALSYAYRSDGRREQLLLGNGSSFTWKYTAAGRELSQADPLLGSTITPEAAYTVGKIPHPYYPNTITYGSWTQSFDSYGRISGITFPVTLFSDDYDAYDLDDQVAEQTALTYVPPGSGFQSAIVTCLASNVRNEKIASPTSSSWPCSSRAVVPQLHSGGDQVAGSFCAGSNGCPIAHDWQIDSRSGMQLTSMALASNTGLNLGSTYAYDLSGRLTQDSESRQETITYPKSATFTTNWCPIEAMTASSPPVTCSTNGTRQKTYDAENRLRSESFSWVNDYASTATSYGAENNGSYWEDTSGYTINLQPATLQAVDYMPSNHPMRLALYHPDQSLSNPNAEYQNRAWLWDGNDRFLECHLSGTACQSPRLSIEGLGDYDPGHGTLLDVNDRNDYGAVVLNRTATGFNTWTEAPNRPNPLYGLKAAPCSGASANATYTDVDGFLHSSCDGVHDGKVTVDGWTFEYETWQGVRTFDPAIGQWNTPDAYAGDAHDPMSQKPYMWNRNNPYAYSDPSGYEAGDPDARELMSLTTSRVVLGPEGYQERQAAAVSQEILKQQAASETLSANVAAGRTFEVKAGVAGPKTRITYPSGRHGYPDKITTTSVEEAKAGSYQSLTKQLKGQSDYAAAQGLEHILHMQTGSTVSQPLQKLIDAGLTVLKNW